jgi:hypothetical protein
MSRRRVPAGPAASLLGQEGCVYRKLKPGRSDGEARRGSGVNEWFRSDESDDKSPHPCKDGCALTPL